jgi:hypothetical protein
MLQLAKNNFLKDEGVLAVINNIDPPKSKAGKKN